MEALELLDQFGYDTKACPVVKGSALLALNGKKLFIYLWRTLLIFFLGDKSYFGEESIHRLIKALDDYIKEPTRDVNGPALMPIDNILTVPGRGTIVIGNLIVPLKNVVVV